MFMMAGGKIEADVLAEFYLHLFFWTFIERKVVIGLVEQSLLDRILWRNSVLGKEEIHFRIRHFFTQVVLCADL